MKLKINYFREKIFLFKITLYKNIINFFSFKMNLIRILTKFQMLKKNNIKLDNFIIFKFY